MTSHRLKRAVLHSYPFSNAQTSYFSFNFGRICGRMHGLIRACISDARMFNVAVPFKVRKTAKIRKRYNQVAHLTQDTTWESNKNTINITNKSQEVSPFPSGDLKAAMNRRESIRNTRQKKQMIHKRSTAFERSVKIFYSRALTGFTAPTSPLVQMWIKTHRCLVYMKDP